MESIKNTPLYQEAIQELNYSYGNFYLFENFVVGEINKDVVFSWKDHAKAVVEEISDLYDQNGEDLVYISNRIHPYSVIPSDWLNFFKHSYSLKGYGIVSYTPKGILNSLLEKLFLRGKLRSFDNLTEAISWAKNPSKTKENAA